MIDLENVLSKNSALQLSSVTLAFIGDAVHSLYVRKNLVFEKDEKGAVLNKKASDIVRASAQADFIDKILPILNEEEVEVYKRARNTKKGTRAKNATVGEYNKATGFEALVGFLYLTGQKERLNYLLSYGENDEN
ncbi:MAG: Mini-ribonuclease 3 [Clostridia bacterium]|nr:Mini-ribonuclease 3 [Clostridia bacterium]